MPRPWRRGPARGHLLLGLAVVIVVALGWVFGTRLYAIWQAAADLRALRAEEEALHAEIGALQRKLAASSLPEVVEREARHRLRWGFPNEERIVILRR